MLPENGNFKNRNFTETEDYKMETGVRGIIKSPLAESLGEVTYLVEI